MSVYQYNWKCFFFQEECEIPLYPGSDLPELTHVVIGLESKYMYNMNIHNSLKKKKPAGFPFTGVSHEPFQDNQDYMRTVVSHM